MAEINWFYLSHLRDNGRKRWYYRANPPGRNDWWVILRGDGMEWFAELWDMRHGVERILEADNVNDLKLAVETYVALKGLR